MADYHITQYWFSGTVITPNDPIYSSLSQRLAENCDGVVRGFIPIYLSSFLHNPAPGSPIFSSLVDPSDAANYSDWGKFQLTGQGVYSNADPSEQDEIIPGELITSFATVPGDAGDFPADDNEFNITLFQTEDQTGKWLIMFQGTMGLYLPLDPANFPTATGSYYVASLRLERPLSLSSGNVDPKIQLIVRGPVSANSDGSPPFNRLLTKAISASPQDAIKTIPYSETVLFGYISKKSGTKYVVTFDYTLRDEGFEGYAVALQILNLASDLKNNILRQL